MIRAAGIAVALVLTIGAACWHSAGAQNGDNRYPFLERPTEKAERTVKRKRYVKRTKYVKRYRAAKWKRAVRRYGGKVSRPAVIASRPVAAAPLAPVVVPTIVVRPPIVETPLTPEPPPVEVNGAANRFDHAFGALTPPPPMPAAPKSPTRDRARKWPTLANHGMVGEFVIAFALAGLAFAAVALLMASIRQDNQAATEERT